MTKHRREAGHVHILGDGVQAGQQEAEEPADFFSCNSLVRSSGRFGEYYRSCRGGGMCYGEALKATVRKRMKVVYAIMRDKVPYAA